MRLYGITKKIINFSTVKYQTVFLFQYLHFIVLFIHYFFNALFIME